MAKYKSKSCVIEAVLWTGENIEEIKLFAGDKMCYDILTKECAKERNLPRIQLSINTLEGEMLANVGDYIIKGVRGEFYPCKPDVFHKKYQLIK